MLRNGFSGGCVCTQITNLYGQHSATLAGGVAGSSSDLVIQPWGAIMMDAWLAVSVAGYVYIQPMAKPWAR